jgi:hypothetical protein
VGHSIVGKWFISALDKIAKQVDEEGGVDTVAKIDRALGKYEEKGFISKEEQDALRHYYGMRTLSNKYGGTVAWIAGHVNEGFDRIAFLATGNEDQKIQADVDIFNNAVSLRHAEEGRGQDIREDMTEEELRKPLKFLKVPPKPEAY